MPPDGSVGYLAVVAVVLQRSLTQTEDTANLLAGEVDLLPDGRTVCVDQYIYGLNSRTMLRRSSLNSLLSRVMMSSYMALFSFYQILFQQAADIFFPEYYFVADGSVGYYAAGTIILQGSFGYA